MKGQPKKEDRLRSDPRSPHAVRQQRYRQRQQRRELVVTLALRPDEADKLHRLHYLGLDQLENREAVAAAIRGLLGNIILGP